VSRRGDTRGVYAATAASAGMIAQQVAGKAVRDALFLTQFDVSWLAPMMAAAAVLSLGSVLWIARLITRFSPARVVPLLFAANGLALVGEWTMAAWAPRLTAVLVYLHTAVFAPVLISSFWSLMNERFDPHTARGAVGRVAGGGTAGGVLGSVVAWRSASVVAVPTMLLVLAAISAVCVVGTLMLRSPVTPLAAKKEAEAADAPDAAPSALQVFRDAPYLRALSWLVALGAITSSLLDFVFNAEASLHVARGPQLLAFFGLFWLVVSVLSFLLQALLGKVALERLGLAVTVALLPGIVVLGGAIGLAVPGLASSALLRGAEAVQRNSLFRSAYELLYTPLPEEKKRTTKTIIDVAFDRAGTIAGSGLVYLALRFLGSSASLALLIVGIAVSFVTLVRARTLHRGYIGALEESLKLGAVKLRMDDVPDRATRRILTRAPSHSDAVDPERVIEALEKSDGASPTHVAVKAVEQAVVKAEAAAAPSAGETEGELHALLGAIRDLRSGDHARVARALAGETLDPALIPHALLVLAHPDLYVDAGRALVRTLPDATGQLLDALLSPKTPFVIRRRIPRVMSRCPTQRAADGLVRGLADARFEVRYECGRALLFITEASPELDISMEAVLSAVKMEVAQSSDVWEAQSEFDADDDERPTLIDNLLRDRVHRSLEHVFNVLSLRLEREPLRLAFKALHQEDESLRGTALEYLENVLPEEVREAVWPFVGEARPMRAARPAREILDDLLRGAHGAATAE
jgi:ATP:ADP antiporter, AAA family